MPFYEYRCDACGHELEAMQKISDAPLADCPACNQPALVKLVSAAGFRLKGSGWYVTDFKNSGKPEQKKATDKASGDKGSGEKASGDKAGGKSGQGKGGTAGATATGS